MAEVPETPPESSMTSQKPERIDQGDSLHMAEHPEFSTDEVPDGGMRAWLVVSGCFFTFFASIGWVYAIGAFQAYYQSHQYRGRSPGAISWVSSLELALIFILSPFAVGIFRKYGGRKTIAAGAVIHVFGLMMTSLSKRFYQVILAQGICSPIGAALTYHAASQTIPTWFKNNQPLAFGICTLGSSLAGVVFPLMVSRVVDDIGYPWTMRAIAFTVLGACAIGVATVETRVPVISPAVAKDALRNYFSNRTLMIAVAATFISWTGYWVPLNYIGAYGLAKGMPFRLSSDLIVIMNAASCPGRLVFPGLAKKFGVLNVLIINTVIIVLLVFANWIPAESHASIIVFSALYGFFSGGPLPLLLGLVSQLVDWDPLRVPVALGLSMLLIAPGALISEPIAGAILDHTGSWLGMKLFSGITQAVSVLLYVYVRIRGGGLKSAVY